MEGESSSLEALAAKIKEQAGIAPEEGPSYEAVAESVTGFIEQFEYWFTRVIAGAVEKYNNLIIKRINPIIRPIEFDGLAADAVADRLVSDYVNRNFVTAGGWAIEKMAVAIVAKGNKAAARGIDLHRIDDRGNHHLYVIKSGTVTRNSDILSSLKQHARDAEKLLKQGGAKIGVFANYAVATGATGTTFEDGIYRPSSGMFWSEVTGLPEAKALALIGEIAKASGTLVKRDTEAHVNAMVTLVFNYIVHPEDPNRVDWPFLFKRNMTVSAGWKEEDKARDRRARDALRKTGYKIKSPKQRAKMADIIATDLSLDDLGLD